MSVGAPSAGSVVECRGAGRSTVGDVDGRMFSLCVRTESGRLRGGVEGSLRSRSDDEIGSSCISSPLKSVMMLFQSELSDSREDILVRGSGALDDAAAMTRLRSTSPTLMLRRLFRFATTVPDVTVSWVTVAVGDGVRARVETSTIEWSKVSSISVSESVS